MPSTRHTRPHAGAPSPWTLPCAVCLLFLLFLFLLKHSSTPTKDAEKSSPPRRGDSNASASSLLTPRPHHALSLSSGLAGSPKSPFRRPRQATPHTPRSVEPEITIAETSIERTVVVVTSPLPTLEAVTIAGQPATRVFLGTSRHLKQRGCPALPFIRTNLLIADSAAPSLRIIESTHVDQPAPPPVPSLGFIERGAQPQPPPQPFFGTAYASGAPYPETPARLTKPYNIRRCRGVGLLVSPTQYLPATGILRTYTRLVLEVTSRVGNGSAGIVTPPGSPTFAALARASFANYDALRAPAPPKATDSSRASSSTPRESTLQDASDGLLVISSTAFASRLNAFVEWKRQRGLVVTTATYPADTGSGTTALKNYIRTHYEDSVSPISHVILVSDYDGVSAGDNDIPVYQTFPNPTDTLYTTLSGDDDYHDLIISRISANTVEELDNQLTKLVDYEKLPQSGDGAHWYTKATMVGSNEGAGTSAFGKYDWEILDAERADLLANGFTEIEQIYDPGATADEVVTTWNGGMTLLYYLGHGTETSWNTSLFNVTRAGTLANGAALPFVINGNCKNGNFLYTNGDCLAEAMLKTGDTGSPAGAIGVLCSTTNMDWDPPVVMLQAFTDYLLRHDPVTAGEMTFDGAALTTLGGHAFLSIQRAMDYCIATPDEGGPAAIKIMEQTHLLGDCTLGLRTTVPFALDVAHDDQIVPEQAFAVTVRAATDLTPLPDAMVCLYRDPDIQIVGLTDSQGKVSLSPGAAVGEPLLLTVYHRNAIPQQVQIHIASDRPVITSSSVLPVGFVAEPYSFTARAVGGTQPLTWSLAPGHPEWLAVAPSTGLLTGTPDAPAVVTATLTVSDASVPPETDSQVVTLTVGTAVDITAVTLPSGVVGAVYSEQVSAEGSFGPFTFGLKTGALPSGLTLTTDGTIHGVPSRSGSYPFTVTVRDQRERSDDQGYVVDIAASDTVEITTVGLDEAPEGKLYSVPLQARGGSGGGYTWRLVGGTLPDGLSLAGTGTLQGTPAAVGVFTFRVRVEDDQDPPAWAEKALTLAVTSAVHFTGTVLPAAVVDRLYSAQIPVAGSYAPFEFSTASSDTYETSTIPTTFAEVGTKQAWQDDETEYSYNLPFTFPYFGSEYTECRISDNGYVIFGPTSPDDMWDASVSSFAQFPMVAPFWTDLQITAEFPDTGIFIDASDAQVTVRWRGRDYHDEENAVNMAVTLYADGRIRFGYGGVETTNRVVVGISSGIAGDAVVVYSHVWSSVAPTPVVGWTDHDDITFAVPEALPAWLALSSDGQLTGTPPEAGEFTVPVNVSDQAGNTASQNFVLHVGPPPEADLNQDGDVDNAEILAFIELWQEGTTPETQLQTAIDLWRAGPPNGRDRKPRHTPKLPRPKVRRVGEILVLQLLLGPAEGMARRLLEEGYDVARIADGIAEIYATQSEYDALVAAGLSPVITARQVVGDSAGAAETPPSRAAPAGYTDYTTMSAQLQVLVQDHAAICRLTSIGQSVQGRDLWVVTVSDNPDSREAEPTCTYIATIHGDEPIGMELCLRFLDLLTDNYRGSDAFGQRISDLVDNTRIVILPCLNPDGFENRTRYNHNGTDLNRDFPDGALSDIGTHGTTDFLDLEGRQPETIAVMQWSAQSPSSLSASFHSGAFLVCYPFGNNPQQQDINTPTLDDTLFRHLTSTYATHHTTMSTGSVYSGGIINSAQWYAVDGEMADWNYRYLGALETTVELSNVKTPDAVLLPGLWDDNSEAMLSYAEAARAGVGGVITDASTGSPLWAQVTPSGLNVPTYSHATGGDYHRILLPGTYALEFASPGYWTRTEADVTIIAALAQRLDLQLTPASHTVTRSIHRFYEVPADPVVVTLSLQIDEGTRPSGVILSESFAGGFTYRPGTTVDPNGSALAEPRQDGSQCSWLFWGNQVQDAAINYSLNADTTNGPTRVTGELRAVDGTVPAVGPKEWDTGEYEWTIRLAAGWNLISVPLDLSSPGTEQVFSPEPPAIYGWNGLAYYSATTIESKKGYWIYSESNRTITVTGTPPNSSSRHFTQGWNLFGCIETTSQLETPELIRPVWEWGKDGYWATSQLTVGRGYWGYATQEVDIPLAPTR